VAKYDFISPGELRVYRAEWVLKSFQDEISELSHGFTIADEFTQNKILADLKSKYSFRFFDSINTKFDTHGQLLETNDKKKALINDYHNELKLKNLIDYDQILYTCYHFLKNNRQATKLISSIFKWIIVDEYQDTQELQYRIIGLLRSRNSELRVSFVGDPDQAIFTSLGGVAYSKSELETICSIPLTEHNLFGCYRSSQKIIDYYSLYKGQKGKIISLSNSQSLSTIHYDKTISKDILPAKIIAVIRQQLSLGVPQDQICVLSPQWDNLQEIVTQLKKVAPDLSLDAPGVSPISKNRENIWYPLSKILLTDSSPENFRKRIKWAREVLKFLKEISGSTLTTPLQFLEFANSSKSKAAKGTDYLNESIKNVLNLANIDIKANPLIANQLSKFLEGTQKRVTDLGIDNDIETFKSYYREKAGIVLSSFHGVKGEEYEIVIAMGLLRGKIPHWDCIINTSHLQDSEANKLLYVIASRAKTSLYLFSETGHVTQSRNPYVPTEQFAQSYPYDK